MTVFGYTLAILGVLFGGCLSAWAILMGFQSLFPRRSEYAQRAIIDHPWRWTVIGFIVWLSFGLIGLVLIQQPNPLAKLIGTLWMSAITAFTAVGASGLIQLLGSRLREKDPAMSEYGSQSRAGLILVSSGLLPFVGWFAIVPLLLAMGLGAGIRAVFTRAPQSSPASTKLEFGA